MVFVTLHYLMMTFVVLNLVQFIKTESMVCTRRYTFGPIKGYVSCADDEKLNTYIISQCKRNATGPPVGISCLQRYKGNPCHQYAIKRPNGPKMYSCYRHVPKSKKNPDKDFNCDGIKNFMYCENYPSVSCLKSNGCNLDI
ncbi:secreted protein [Melampsora americana]|nr:secreted protein [Melampsora americana]